MSKTEKTSIEFSDLNVTLSLDTDNFPEELKTPLSQTYDPESTYAMSGVAVGEALKPVYDKISTVLGGVDQTYSPRSASAQSGIAVKQAIDDVENRIKEFDNALEGCNDAVIMAREAANRAAASSISAQKSASTAVFAKSDLETARDTAVSAATTATDAASAASSVKSYLETARDTAVSAAATATNAAAAAATAQTAAEAAQAQADTDARACAIYDQRVAANKAASDEAVATAQAAATAAADSATAAAVSAQSIDTFALAAQIAAGTASMADGIIMSGAKSDNTTTICAVKNYKSSIAICDYLIIHGDTFVSDGRKVNKCLFSDTCKTTPYNDVGVLLGNECFVHMPNFEKQARGFRGCGQILTFSSATKFDNAVDMSGMFQQAYGSPKKVNWANGTTFSSLQNADGMFYRAKALYSNTSFLLTDNLPDTITFENLQNAQDMFYMSGVRALPAAMVLRSLTNGKGMFHGCPFLEIEDLVRVCLTINDLQSLETPTTGPLGLPASCKHNGETVDTQSYLNANHPDFLVTLNARGWTVSFA